MPAADSQLKRRSKSLDDLALKCTIADTKAWLQSDPDHLCHYNDASTPTSPVVSFTAPADDLPRRRHSAYCEPASSKECLRLATIYGWVTTNTLSCPYDMDRFSSSPRDAVHLMPDTAALPRRPHPPPSPPPMLYPSRSFTHDYSTKLSKMFMRKRTLDKRKQSMPSIQIPAITLQPEHPLAAAAPPPLDNNSSTHHDDDDDDDDDAAAAAAVAPLPTPPIENDPHVFDLLAKDLPCFITYNPTRDDSTMVMSSATVEKLVEKLTSQIDSEFLMDFFLTYRQFLSAIKLCKLLILRFRWALLESTDARSLVRIRTFVVIRHWLTHYWDQDFARSRTLRFILSTFLSELRTHPTVLASPRDARIIKSLRNLFKRQRRQQQEEQLSPRSRRADPPVQLSGQSSISTMSGLFGTQRSSTSSNSADGGEYRGERKDSGVGILHQQSRSFSTRPNSTPAPSSSLSSSPWATRVSSSLKSIKRSVWHRASSASASSCASDEMRHPSASGGYPSPQPSVSTPIPSQLSSINPVHRQHHHSYPPNLTPSPSHRLLRPPPSLGIERLSATIFGSDASKCTYRSLILQYRTETVAQQFCMIERQMLQSVTWDELIELRWKNRGGASLSPCAASFSAADAQEQSAVEQLIGYFNRTCQWVTSEIVQSQSLELRVRVIEKYIRIALKCYMHRNYSTLMQILLGLQSPAVSRLEKTWQRVNTYEMQIMNELKEMTKPFRNWKNIRTAMTKAIEDIGEASAVESILTQAHDQTATGKLASDVRGSIPFLGLYLSDLVFNSELPSTLAGHRGYDSASNHPDPDTELRMRLSTQLVNYNKFRITASVVRHVLAFQMLSRAYSFDYHPDLFSKLQQLQCLDNAEIRKASLLCEE